ESQTFLAGNASRINGLYVMGGNAAIPAETLTAARAAATPVQVTAEITAAQGANTFTVKFSEPVVAKPAASAFSFASVGRTISVAADADVVATPGVTDNTSFTVTITPSTGTGFVPGDVVNLAANAVTSATTGRQNAAASTTVAVDTTR